MTDLLALAERCEQATVPDRRLDVEIAVAADWRWPDWEEGESTARSQAEKHGVDWLAGRAAYGVASMWRHMPRYTASLDAAMTLAPEGWSVNIVRTADKRFGNANLYWFKGGNTIPAKKMHGAGATPALALCAAALRARAASAMSAGTAETQSGSGRQPASAVPQADAQPTPRDTGSANNAPVTDQ